MSQVLIDGKLYDSDTFTEVSVESGNKSHNMDFIYDDSSNTFHVFVERNDGKTWSWDLQSDRIGGLVDNLDRVDSVLDSVEALEASVETLSSTSAQSLDELASVPDDFYTYVSDVSGQIVFFISLMFGLMVFLIFCQGLKR